MTTIAWDGNTLAVDRQCSWGCTKTPQTKIGQFIEGPYKNCIFASCGEAEYVPELIHWFETLNADPNLYPATQKDSDKTQACFMVIGPNKEIWEFGQSAFPLLVEAPYFALGSGMDFAMAAMYCGKNATEAIECASFFDKNSGLGWNAVTIIRKDVFKSSSKIL